MAKKKDISQAVRELCLWFPEAEEVLAHGSPDFRVKGKTFATYVINHHGDGRIALWLNAPRGAQEHYVTQEPKHYFVPPYVGPRGWLGVNLDKGISWKTVARLAREAYEKVAPASLVSSLGKTIDIEPPTTTLKPEDFDPMQSKRAQDMLKELREICLALPETSTVGHNGWIALDVTKDANWREIRSLALFSYRHFALGRMLKALEESAGSPAAKTRKKASR